MDCSLVIDKMSRKSAWRGTLAALALACAVGSFGQVPGDFPNRSGNNQRLGHNGIPNTTGPGRSILHWFDPPITYNNVENVWEPATIILDNTDTLNTRRDFPGQGPFDPPLYTSRISSANYTPLLPPNPSTNWAWPQPDEEAGFPYLLPRRKVAVTTTTPPFARDLSTRFPAYLYTRCTPSLSYAEPTKAKNAADLRSFRFTFYGKTGEPRNYALHVWLPLGPTFLTGQPIFSQRYYVYEVRYGTTAAQKFVDIIDTYATGGGWVRLGNGGAPTNKVFPWDGTNPISVFVYNTVPRTSDGELTMPMTDISGPNGSPDGVVNSYDEDSVKRFATYADAAQAVPAQGSYEATPVSARLIANDAASQILVDARNGLTVSSSSNGSSLRTIEKAEITARTYDIASKNWIRRWRYSPAEETGDTNRTMDNPQASVSGSFVSNNVVTHTNADAYVAPISSTQTGAVVYGPNASLVDGSYEVYAYLPGNNNGVNFGQAVQYVVEAEGTSYTYAVDQSQARGWVRIGDRRFRHDFNLGRPLRVTVTNVSALGSDSLKNAYADAIRFVGDKNQSVSSTPIIATARIMKTGGIIQDTKVVMVADEDGRIHCLDANGNGDGTTTEYWAYPSTKDPDPNQVAGEDGVGGVAEMPEGFDLSTGLVQRVGTEDFFYIASRNGRVYCINMLGRGDYTRTAAGTTTRKWTFPSTYPDANAIPVSPLGSFRGSLVFGQTVDGPTIFAPTTQGRIYALDARGGGTDKKTNVRWAFPRLDQPTLGPIWGTPTFFYSHNPVTGETLNRATAKLVFGTLQKGDEPGRFFCIDVKTNTAGNPVHSPARLAPVVDSDHRVVWFSYDAVDPAFAADVNGFDSGGFAGDYLTSPAMVSYRVLNDIASTVAAPSGGVVYLLNQDRRFFAVDADTGAVGWQTDELGTGSRGSITFQRQLVYDNTGLGTMILAPVVTVGTIDGRFTSLFADNTVNRFGTKRAWEYVAAGDTVTPSQSNAWGWLFGADSVGYLYAWQNSAGNYGTGQQFPGQETITENNVVGDIFRKAKIKFITRDAYTRLRLPTGDPQQLTYAQALANASANPRSAFEWGETVYALVYDLPYRTTAPNGTTPVPPPIVNFSFNVEGYSPRQIPVEARQFSGAVPQLNQVTPDIGLPPPPEGTTPLDGYAILAFPFQGGGANALPPGNANVAFSISSQGLNNNGAQQNVALRPDLANKSFKMANPLAISMKDGRVNSGEPVPAENAASKFSMGYAIDPANPERLENGNSPTKINLAKSTEWAQHGQSKGTTIFIYDVSMMGLLRPDGMGLENVRVNREDLARQGGAAGVYKALNQALYPRFEDLPVNFPNTSLDYPDIARENIRVTKDPNGDAENPLFNGVQLRAAKILQGGVLRPMQEGDVPYDSTGTTKRVFQPTPVAVDVDVPRFQPPVWLTDANKFVDSEGNKQIQGYLGRLTVFVDSFQNGNVDVAQREPYRGFTLLTGVSADEKIAVTTPSLDLGSIPTGGGFSSIAMPGYGFTATPGFRVFHPWTKDDNTETNIFKGMFREINVENQGNVNLLNLRVAKGEAISDGNYHPWFFSSVANDPLAWLEGGFATNAGELYTGNLWSDLDFQFSPWATLAVNPDRNVILQKPRVTDRVPTALTVNPRRRANPNIAAVDSALFNETRFPVRSPRVGVSVPIGFPSGRYGQRMRIIENTSESTGTGDRLTPTWSLIGDPWSGTNRAETASDPTFDLFFSVREARLTGYYTQKSDRMIDGLDSTTGGTPTATSYANQMPSVIRDAFGSMLLAWSSNRPNWNVDATVAGDPSAPYKLYIASLDSAWTFTGAGYSGPNSQSPSAPLRDLNNWRPNNGRWWNRAVQNFPPTNPNTLFGVQTGESIVTSSVRYTSPSFPAKGMQDAFDPTNTYTGVFLGFVGDAQKTTPSGTLSESRIMLSTVTTDASGAVSASAPVVMPGDPYMKKGKPSLVQTDTGAMIFFTGTAGGQNRLYYSRYDSSGFNPISPLPMGPGFDTVSSPSAAGRRYLGAGAYQSAVELTFAGRLRGRPYSETFIGRLLALGGAGADRLSENTDRTLDEANAFVWLPYQSDERLVLDGTGAYRSRGVVWNLNMPRPITVTQMVNGARTNVLIDGWNNNGTPNNFGDDTYVAANDTRTYDPNTGVISYQTRLGGQVYIDPALGTFKFTGALPSSSAELLIGYQPRFIRVNPAGTASYSGPNGVFDSRLISDVTYWRNASGAAATTEALRNDRMFFTYNRAAAGSGQAARPYLTTFRFGVRLPYRIATGANGAPLNVQVSGNSAGYQMDPAQGKIYFMAEDEDRLVTVTFTGVDAAGNLVTNVTITAPVSYVLERAEEPIAIEQAVNESDLSVFLDPFTYLNNRRPPLVWLFWTSTRSGNPDLYFETIAPQWAPVPVGR
jgi:hypothetical protein